MYQNVSTLQNGVIHQIDNCVIIFTKHLLLYERQCSIISYHSLHQDPNMKMSFLPEKKKHIFPIFEILSCIFHTFHTRLDTTL